ncbi:MAG: hypothetical protein ABL903_08520 [Methylococcales bacterium]
MWTPLRLAAPPLGSAASANAAVRMVSVDPWSHGKKVDLVDPHTYLSFPNAVSAVVDEIGQGAAQAALGIAVTAASLSDMANNLAAVAGAFPLPNLQRLARRATALVDLDMTKFDLVPYGTAESTVNMSSLPSVKALRRADLLAAASDAATAFLGSDPTSALAALVSDKAAHASMVAGAQAAAGAGLTGTPLGCYRFYAEGDIASALLNGHPGHEYTLTSIMLFMGSIADLAVLQTIITTPL